MVVVGGEDGDVPSEATGAEPERQPASTRAMAARPAAWRTNVLYEAVTRSGRLHTVAVLLLLTACAAPPEAETGDGPVGTATATSSSTSGALAPSTSGAVAATTYAPPTTARPTRDFSAEVSPVAPADLSGSWRPGCPVPPEELRLVKVTYWGFDDQAHDGSLVVNVAAAQAMVEVFRQLFDQRFPIRRMEPIDAFAGDDDASMAADNTSAFNCRNAIALGSPHWSMHAYGLAIDVNPVENPYLLGDQVLPPAGRAYLDRSSYRPGMAVEGGPLTTAFASVGWQWGGRWSSPDYQHFSSTGR
jgi:hypothetical protein